MHLTQKVGSTVYMAPEVTLGGKYNEKVDVFSFGVIVYEVFMQSVILVKHAMLRDGEDMTNYSERVAQGHRYSTVVLAMGFNTFIDACNFCQDDFLGSHFIFTVSFQIESLTLLVCQGHHLQPDL